MTCYWLTTLLVFVLHFAEFLNPISLEDTLVKVIAEDFDDPDAEDKAPNADAIGQVEELLASAPMPSGVSSPDHAATTGLERVTMVPKDVPGPLLERFLRRTLLNLNSGFD